MRDQKKINLLDAIVGEKLKELFLALNDLKKVDKKYAKFKINYIKAHLDIYERKI
jgi:hypothetical protein